MGVLASHPSAKCAPGWGAPHFSRSIAARLKLRPPGGTFGLGCSRSFQLGTSVLEGVDELIEMARTIRMTRE
jgi:hypothetical protein